ncbi:MAG: glycosyl transferase [Anaerolineales bacterium]|nr:glycosyl transferase [Anaerolineales bacterium]MCX7608024.1 glycosyl transferase [Anaerolineales bacterium]MDW8227510.1 glycosyl transferase [Anaerolineales bacterium]
MRFGYFDDEHREYVITRPDTPLPWINYLGCEDYIAILSNTAGGYSFFRDARLRRLTRYRYNNAPLDMGGRYIYLRDESYPSAPPLVWSPTWMPVRAPLDGYECRHGLGYTIIRSRKAGIAAQVRYFVPLGATLEIWELTLTNERAVPASLSVFAGVEFALWDALDDATNFQRNYSIGEVEVDFPAAAPALKIGGVIYHKSEYRERRNHFAFFASSEPLTGFDTSREAFLGPYRGWDSPQAVEMGQTSQSIAHGWQPIGAHHIRLDLPAGEKKQILFVLGYHENPPQAKFSPPDSQTLNRETVLPLIQHYLNPAVVQDSLKALQHYWENLLGKFTIHTPDIHTNRMVNIWNPYQVMTTFNLSRSASYFESGIGRGIGFRDANQDLLGFVYLQPERARQRIFDLAATQLPDGGAYHQYQPLTKRGNHEIGSNFNDDPLWLVLSTAAYLKETGDWSILEVEIPYDHQPKSETPLLEHLQRAIGYTLERLGPHGLPLIGRADWNDCLNLNAFSDTPGQSFQTVPIREGKVAESIFIAGLFILACREMAELLRHAEGHLSLAKFALRPREFYLQAAQEMEKRVWEYGWDGAWFRRAYDSYGQPLGSLENREGQIFIEPQGICVMAGLGLEDGRAQQALDAVAEHLATPHGLLLLQPAFSRYYLHLGEISSYPPGYKENGAVFCHTNPWIIIAEAMLGRGDRAHDYYLRINPSAREEISEIHRCEPYVYAQMIAGKDAPTFGEAKNSWLTGTASWSLVAISQWILGIRPEYGGLRIDPCIPHHWDGFEVQRSFRGGLYRIHVYNPIHCSRGVSRILLNGQPLETTLLPPSPGSVQHVEVWLGKKGTQEESRYDRF